MAKAVRMLDSYKPEDVDKYIGSLIAEFDKKCKELNNNSPAFSHLLGGGLRAVSLSL